VVTTILSDFQGIFPFILSFFLRTHVKKQNTWYASFYYENWKGERKRKLKRGFPTKKEALEWEREFHNQLSADLDMTFESFVEIYLKDKKSRLKENTFYIKASYDIHLAFKIAKISCKNANAT
jgi:hypothetical protein